MVKIKATEKLKSFLSSKELPCREVYEYKEIRNALGSAPDDVLDNCSFVWPEPVVKKRSALIEKIIERRKVREYKEMVSNVQVAQPLAMNELKTGLGMGVTLISILFVGMLSGYYLGKYFFGFGEWGSLIVSFIVTVVGIYVEVLLFLIKTGGEDKVKTE